MIHDDATIATSYQPSVCMTARCVGDVLCWSNMLEYWFQVPFGVCICSGNVSAKKFSPAKIMHNKVIVLLLASADFVHHVLCIIWERNGTSMRPNLLIASIMPKRGC